MLRARSFACQRAALGLLCIVATGCAVGPNYKTPDTETPAAWSGTPVNAATQPAASTPTTQPTTITMRPADLAAWWRSLDDPVLDSLIDRAVASNLDLRVATARVREARAQRGVVAAEGWPQINVTGNHAYRGSSLNAGPKRDGGPGLRDNVRSTAVSTAARAIGSALAGNAAGTGNVLNVNAISNTVAAGINSKLGPGAATASRDQNLFQAGFDAAWELDVFGGTRRAVEAADADLAATEEARRATLVTLTSEVALNYVRLRGAQRRLAIARENIRVQQDTLELTQMRFDAGFTSELDVAQARTQLATTQSQVPLLDSEIKQAIHRLGVLLGRLPATLRAELNAEQPIPLAPPEVPIGMPSDLLRRRPDIRAAERQLAAATARIGEAVADLFPRFSLTGSFGPQSRTMRHFLDSDSFVWSVGPAVSWPVLDGWRIRSNVAVQNARQEQAVATYEQTVLTAFQEVEDALTAFANEQVRQRSLVEAVDASRRAAELSNDLYTRGLADFLNVLESQRVLYASQDALVQSETAVTTNLITLYKSLGGGWDAVARADTGNPPADTGDHK